MKRMQERRDRQKKTNEEKQQKVQARSKKHKRKSTNATGQFTKRTKRNPCTSCEESVGATGPHVATTKYTCLLSERHNFNMLRGTVIAITMTLSTFVLAAFV